MYKDRRITLANLVVYLSILAILLTWSANMLGW